MPQNKIQALRIDLIRKLLDQCGFDLFKSRLYFFFERFCIPCVLQDIRGPKRIDHSKTRFHEVFAEDNFRETLGSGPNIFLGQKIF